MEFEIWHYWIIAAMFFFLMEIFIPSFIMASIGVGCLFAFCTSLLCTSLSLQLVFFIAGTTAGLVGVKPLMKRYAYRQKALKTNASGLIGRIGKVIEEIDENLGTGCVAIDGDQWKSISNGNDVIHKGEKVRVTHLNSIVLTVEPLEDSHPHKSPEHDLPQITEKERFSVRLGSKTYFVGFDEIGFLYSSNKMTYLVTTTGKQLVLDMSLESVDAQLPEENFYRANRQFIVARNVISEIRSVSNGKLNVVLKASDGSSRRISVSRLKAAAFRKWLNGSVS